MTTPSITSTPGQEEQLIRFASDAARRGASDALKKVSLDKDAAQRIIMRGGEYQVIIERAAIAALRELAVEHRYANEKISSRYGYPRGYQRPKSVEDQVKLLLDRFPHLNPESAFRYARDVYVKFQLPSWVEGPFVTIAPNAFYRLLPVNTPVAEQYCGAVGLAIAKLAESRQFHNYREGQFTADRFRVAAHTAAVMAILSERQPGDLWIVGGQFGKHYAGHSVRLVRDLTLGPEFGAEIVGAVSMLLTHPERLVAFEDLWIDVPGNEFAPDEDGSFDDAPYFHFARGELKLGTRRVSDVPDNYGSVSFVLPQ